MVDIDECKKCKECVGKECEVWYEWFCKRWYEITHWYKGTRIKKEVE